MKQNNDKKGFWIHMWPYIREHKGKLIFCVICALIVGVCVAVQPLVIKYIVDSGISNDALMPNDKIRFVGMLCLLYIAIATTRVFIWRMGFTKMFRALEGSLFNLRSKFFAHVQQMGMKFYESTSAGELFNCIMGTPMVNIKTYMSQIFMGVPYQVVSLAISLTALLYYDWVLTVILLATAMVMALFNKFARRKMRRVSTDYIRSEAEASKYLSDTLNGMDAVKLYSIEDNTFKNFQNILGQMYEKGVVASTSQQKESLKPELIQYIGTAVVYFVGAISCVYRGVSVGVLYAFLSSMTSILGILITWLNIGLQKSSAESGLNKIMAILNTSSATPEKEETRQRSVEVERDSAMKKQKPCIAFENIDFAYENRKIFENFSCSIRYGESVALVGSSGSGKSTFSKLAMRLYDVQNGAVLVHGKDVRDYSLHDLRVSFGIVPQSTFIFYGSIWDNIKIARPDASNKDIVNAMEIAHVHEFVNELENGWNTVVGDGGLDLSGGQKQRIAIARAVLGNPDILIFDEATSALDNISEHAIQDAMETLMKTHTVIIIAHRLSTIRNVDRILVFESGKVVEEGSYDALSQKEGGTFAELLKYNK
ncbi:MULTISPECIES: ABC transporter ATP-binding protein [Congzhengia]|uniref:ABC transporter ATP-binding protein n=1 Tax=Congzhengia minquanensis TaxID=2763657 RepID=A0A926HZK1_9FIRM|nr:ABC transporter ATP-binding protein [Congzhengia minquanensis]MBC8541533.1 ABC transporter ATP-binding protein [Congzhengia minquanensis]